MVKTIAQARAIQVRRTGKRRGIAKAVRRFLRQRGLTAKAIE